MPVGMTHRAAQPPGGRSSISFNDGSDFRMPSLPAPPPPPARTHVAQAPGGDSSWSFDDRSGNGPQDVRHTNGLLRKINNGVPSGGYSSIDLSDASANRGRAYPGDALDAFVAAPPPRRHAPPPFVHDEPAPSPSYSRRAPPPFVHDTPAPTYPARSAPPAAPSDSGGFGHRPTLAPPGGRSSFSLGWGDDGSCNHHHHYHRREPERGHQLAMPHDGGAREPRARDATASFERAFAADQKMASIPTGPPQARERSGLLDFTGGGGGGGGWGGGMRNSTRVAAPPGGASSIVFG